MYFLVNTFPSKSLYVATSTVHMMFMVQIYCCSQDQIHDTASLGIFVNC